MTDENRPDENTPDEDTSDENTSEEKPGRDWQKIGTIALAAVLAIVVGVAVGWSLTGSTSVTTTTIATAGPTATTAPQQATTTTASAAPPETSVPGQVTLTPVDDTYVNEEDPTDINGLEDLLEIENDPPEIKQALIRFEVTGVPEGETIRSATLRLFVVDDSDDTLTVHLVDGPWSQADTSASNAPTLGAQVATISGPGPENQMIEVDLSSAVTQPGEYSFYIASSGDDSVEFASLESGANSPTLVVRWLDDLTAGGQGFAGSAVRMVGAGGIADCGDGAAVTGALVEQAVRADPQAIVFTTGNNAVEAGSVEEYASCYDPAWGGFKETTRPAPGETEYETEGATGYFGYYGAAAGPAGSGYYSYEAGEWQVVVLNSNCEAVGGCQETSPQGQWLSAELADSDTLCTVAYWHHPMFTSSPDGGSADVAPLYNTLYEHRAELILTGGTNYERFALQGPDGIHDPVAGIRQFVIGTGGAGLGEFGDVAPNSEARNSESLGVLELDLYDNGYEWGFAAEPGSDFVDTGSRECH